MEINSKNLNNHVLYNNYRSFFPDNIFSPNQIWNKEYENDIFSKDSENKNNNNSLRTRLIMNYSNNNLFDKMDYQNALLETKDFKGKKLTSSNNYFKNFHKTQNKHTKFRNLQTVKVFFDQKNKINKSNRNTTNNIFKVKISKIKKNENYLNRSCPMINNAAFKKAKKTSENTELEEINKNNDETNNPLENEKNFYGNSNIYKIEFIKKIIRKHYFENFDNLKEFFNNISGREKYVTIDDIIFYLKDIVKVNIDKKEIRQLLYINGIIKVDFNNFKFIFFPDLKMNKMINLKLKNEKCNFYKKEAHDNINNGKYFGNIKESFKRNKNYMPLIIKKETQKKDTTNKSIQEKMDIFQKNDMAQKLKFRGINNKMRFLLIDINKDYILKRFNEKYELNKNYLKFRKSQKLNNNKNIDIDKKNESKKIKKININLSNSNNTNIKTSKSSNHIEKDKLKLFILKVDNIENINKIEEMRKTSNNNSKEKKKLKIEDYNSQIYKLNSSFLKSKLISSNMKNDIKNNNYTKIDNQTSNNFYKVSSLSTNKMKEMKENTESRRNKTSNQNKEKGKENEMKMSDVINLDTSNRAFLFFKSEKEYMNSNTKEMSSLNNNVQNENDIKINKNSDILNFL